MSSAGLPAPLGAVLQPMSARDQLQLAHGVAVHALAGLEQALEQETRRADAGERRLADAEARWAAEKASLLETVHRLSAEVGRLEKFRRGLLQHLEDEQRHGPEEGGGGGGGDKGASAAAADATPSRAQRQRQEQQQRGARYPPAKQHDYSPGLLQPRSGAGLVDGDGYLNHQYYGGGLGGNGSNSIGNGIGNGSGSAPASAAKKQQQPYSLRRGNGWRSSANGGDDDDIDAAAPVDASAADRLVEEVLRQAAATAAEVGGGHGGVGGGGGGPLSPLPGARGGGGGGGGGGYGYGHHYSHDLAEGAGRGRAAGGGLGGVAGLGAGGTAPPSPMLWQQQQQPQPPPPASPAPPPDGREFFRAARARLPPPAFAAFLAVVKDLNAGKLGRGAALSGARRLLAAEGAADLYGGFEALLGGSGGASSGAGGGGGGSPAS